jgi:AcrR family transcriptional regulator
MSADKTRNTQGTSKQPAPPVPSGERAGSGTRAHILAAAAELAKEKGAAHISIEAIAQRAGISKGGLLYHFPRKDALIRALVELHLAEIDASLAEAEASTAHRRSNAVARAFVELNRQKVCQRHEKPDGILLALAENPHFLDPMRDHQMRIAKRIRNTAVDRGLSLIALLAVEGIRALDLFEANPLSVDECTTVLDRLVALLDKGTDDADSGGTA